jgi:hypothetical protein
MSTPSDANEFALSFLPLLQRFVGNDPNALDQMRAQVENELRTAEEMVVRARAQLDALQQLQSLIDEGKGGGGSDASVPAPPLRKAILRILDESHGMTRDELWDELRRRSWGPGGKTPRNTFISRLSDLAREDVIERDGDYIRLRETQEEGVLAV